MAQNEDSEESKFRLRSYQEEMLEASLLGNVIIKVDPPDTGVYGYQLIG
jgi:hypothetical protein